MKPITEQKKLYFVCNTCGHSDSVSFTPGPNGFDVLDVVRSMHNKASINCKGDIRVEVLDETND